MGALIKGMEVGSAEEYEETVEGEIRNSEKLYLR